MTTNLREAATGRPRQFENIDAFRATTRVLLDLGYSGLTLDAVARESGCSAPAISKRFGSKQGLLHAYLDWSMHLIHERFAAYRMGTEPVLAALRNRLTAPVEDRMEEFGVFVGWFEMRKDPALRPIVERGLELWSHEVALSLTEAQRTGELVACDSAGLSRTVVAALAGAAMLWNETEGPLVERLLTTFDMIIDPYRRIDGDAGISRAEDIPAREA